MSPTFGSLFTGVGGLDLGLERAARRIARTFSVGQQITSKGDDHEAAPSSLW